MLASRELQRSDLAVINKWRSDRALIEQLGAPYRFIEPEVDDKWFNNYQNARSNNVRVVIYDSANPGTPLCLVSLVQIDWVHRTGQFHIMIGDPANRGQGVGTFATQEILRHAFSDLNLHRVELGVLAINEAAFRLYQKMGFVEEGRKREAAYKNNQYIDMIMMAILQDEWLALQNK